MLAINMQNMNSPKSKGLTKIIATIGANAIPQIDPKETVLVNNITTPPKATHIAVKKGLTKNIMPIVVATPLPPLNQRSTG